MANCPGDAVFSRFVQLNVGCNGYWVCFTGFPVKWIFWSDVSSVRAFTSETGINLSLALFAVLLLFGMTLRRNWLVWTQHVLTVLVASLFSWSNPWKQTYALDGLDPYEFHRADAGFPYIFRFVTGLESLPFLLLNLAIAVACVVGLFLALEKFIKARLGGGPTPSSNTFNRWALIVASLLLFVHSNGEAYWTGVPFVFDSPVATRSWAAVVDILIGIFLVAVPLLYSPNRRRSSVMAFVTLYVLANFDNWQFLKEMLGIPQGRGFPVSYSSWSSPEYDVRFLMENSMIGLLLTVLVYRIVPPEPKS